MAAKKTDADGEGRCWWQRPAALAENIVQLFRVAAEASRTMLTPMIAARDPGTEVGQDHWAKRSGRSSVGIKNWKLPNQSAGQRRGARNLVGPKGPCRRRNRQKASMERLDGDQIRSIMSWVLPPFSGQHKRPIRPAQSANRRSVA